MDLYAENILDHYRSPRGKKLLKKPTIEHEEVNASCGDSLTLHLLIKEDTIERVGWDGTGCAISQAGMSLLTEELPNTSVEKAASLSPTFIRKLLGVPVSERRLKCALLPLLALRNALRTAKKQPLLTWPELLEEDNA